MGSHGQIAEMRSCATCGAVYVLPEVHGWDSDVNPAKLMNRWRRDAHKRTCLHCFIRRDKDGDGN